MHCTACGSKRPEGGGFCENCGARVDPQVSDNMPETPADEAVRRWLYEMNLWKNPTVVITAFKVLALAALAPSLLMLVLGIVEGDGLLAALTVFAKVYGIILMVLCLLLLPAYILIAVLNGGRYCVIFEMDAQGVRHTQLQKQYDRAKALGIITALAGAAAGNPTAMGAGLLAASKQSSYSRFQNVRSVTVHERRRVIYLTTRDMVRNQVYAESDSFQAVVDHILSHVSKKADVRYK